MATLGATAEPTSSAEAFSGGTASIHCNLYSIPAGGPWRIQTVSTWCAGYGANTLARHVVWSGVHAILAYSTADFTLVARSFSSTGSDLYSSNVYANGPGLTPLVVAGGSSLFVGFQRSEAGSSGAFFGKLASGTHYDKVAASYLDDLGGLASHAGAMGAYLTYIAANAAPLAPTLLTPTGVIIGTDLTPALGFKYDDPDSDPMSAYEVQISTVSNFASTVWSSGKILQVAADGATVIVNPDGGAWGPALPDLSRGVLYYYRVRCYDDNNAVGPWSP